MLAKAFMLAWQLLGGGGGVVPTKGGKKQIVGYRDTWQSNAKMRMMAVRQKDGMAMLAHIANGKTTEEDS